MARGWLAAAVVALGCGSASAQADAPALRFKWQPGQTLTYRVIQKTQVTETTVEGKDDKPTTATHGTELELTKAWAVKAVDAAGVATLEMSIASMKQTIRQADGKTVSLDSADPQQAPQMAEYLNKPILLVRVDAQGKLVEVKDAKPGAEARLRAELPFRLELPAAGPTPGQGWQRAFAIKLDPPLGTGETHDATQTFTAKGAEGGLAVVGVETSLKAPPANAGEQVPLVPMLWKGDVYFNTAAGKLHAARLEVKAEIANHQGEGTKFVYHSVYAEDAIDK